MIKTRAGLAKLEYAEDWSCMEPEKHIWLVDWKAHDLPYCSVYVIAPDRFKPVKVGIAVAPEKRLSGLQCSHWRHLYVVGCYWFETVKEARAIEAKVHQIFIDEDARLLGEWFDRTPEQARDAIEFSAMVAGVPARTDIPNDAVKEALTKRIVGLSNKSSMHSSDRADDWLSFRMALD